MACWSAVVSWLAAGGDDHSDRLRVGAPCWNAPGHGLRLRARRVRRQEVGVVAVADTGQGRQEMGGGDGTGNPGDHHQPAEPDGKPADGGENGAHGTKMAFCVVVGRCRHRGVGVGRGHSPVSLPTEFESSRPSPSTAAHAKPLRGHILTATAPSRVHPRLGLAGTTTRSPVTRHTTNAVHERRHRRWMARRRRLPNVACVNTDTWAREAYGRDAVVAVAMFGLITTRAGGQADRMGHPRRCRSSSRCSAARSWRPAAWRWWSAAAGHGGPRGGGRVRGRVVHGRSPRTGRRRSSWSSRCTRSH